MHNWFLFLIIQRNFKRHFLKLIILCTSCPTASSNSDRPLDFKKLLRVHDNYAGLTELERKFLKHACSDFTYRQIAMLMNISARTIETCRMHVFQKLNVQSRTGMAMEALRRGLVDLLICRLK
jgi:DNA-binding CsgD family transcriptional regulator